MPFLSRRRSALDLLNANLRERKDEQEPPSRPQTSKTVSLAPPASSRSSRPISFYGGPFTSSRLSHEVRREDVSDVASQKQENRRSKRFSMLKLRNFSESQLAVRAQTQAQAETVRDEDIPPVPAMPSGMQPPALVRTAPTLDMVDEQAMDRRQVSTSDNRSASKKRVPENKLVAPPRLSVDDRDSRSSKRHSIRWRKWQGRSSGLDDLIQLSATQAGKQPEAPPAYGAEGDTELALPVPRFSESSRDDGSHASQDSSSDHIYGATTTTTHTVSTHTTFFRLPRRNKNRNSVLPPPVQIPPPRESSGADGPRTPHAATNASSTQSPPLTGAQNPPTTASRRRSTRNSPSKRNTIIASNASSAHPPLPYPLQTKDLARRPSQKSRASSNSSPLHPPMRLGLRDRASTTSSFGRGSMDTPPLLSGSTRNSTSTTGRSSLGGFLSLSRFRHDSDSPRHESPGTGSKSNSFALSREALVIPEREEGDTPGKYLEKLEAAVSRSVIAGILSKSADPFAQAVLRSYTRRFPFFGEPIDMSLRKFLLEADLPKETQQVDRVIQAFADRYHECNPGVFMAPDQAYIIAFSLMMLHTDAFNKNNKRKMQKQDYIKNTSGQRVAGDVLACFYDNICYTPFVHYEEEVDINGETVLSFQTKKSKAKTSTLESGKKPSGPVDPYNLLVDQKLDALRPVIKDSITLDDPYNYIGTQGPLDIQYLQRAFTHTGVLQIISARSRPTAYQGQMSSTTPLSALDPAESQAGIIDLKITKIGTLWRKSTKKKKTRSPWQEWGAVLTGSQLYLFKNTHWAKGLVQQFGSHQRLGTPRTPVIFKPPMEEFKPDALIKTDDAVALTDSTYTRHKHAFSFVRHGGEEEVFLAENEFERHDWITLINYAAAFRAAGVRIRGMVGGNEDNSRVERRLSSTSAHSSHLPNTDAIANHRALSPQLQKQVMTARRRIIVQRIAELKREREQMTTQLEDMLRDARHLTVLAPISQKAREDVVHAAARADASMKWIRRDIWRLKSYHDILSLDIQQDGLTASELQALTEKAAGAEKQSRQSESTKRELPRLSSQLSTQSRPQSPNSALTMLSRSTSVREAVDEYVNDIFRTPPENATAQGAKGEWHLPPLQLDVEHADREQHRASISSTLLSVPTTSSPPRRTSFSHASSAASSQQQDEVVTPVAHTAEAVRTVTPTPSVPEDEGSVAAKEPSTPELKASRSINLDGTPTSPESNKHKSVRRGLQKTLREVQHHQPTIHKHRRGKDSESTVRSGGDGNDTPEQQQQQQLLQQHQTQQQVGTPGLERAKGRFILHGKQASVIEFGEDWPREQINLRRGSLKNAPHSPRNGSIIRKLDTGDTWRSSVIRELEQDGTDDSASSISASTAQDFVENAEAAHAYASTNGTTRPKHDSDSDSDDERTFYDLSSWDLDPNAGKRETVIGPLGTVPAGEKASAIEEKAGDGEHSQDKTDSNTHGSRGDRRTVIGPSVDTTKMGKASHGMEEAADGEEDASMTEHISNDELLRLVTQAPTGVSV